MNFFIKMLVAWYGFLSLLAVVAPITVSVTDMSTGLVASWLALLIFSSAAANHRSVLPARVSADAGGDDKMLFATTIFSLLATTLLVKFYTGKTPLSVISDFSDGISLYAQYQAYFLDANLSSFSIEKLPYIVLGGVNKLVLVYATLKVIAFRSTRTIPQLFCVATLMAAYVLYAVSRGTSFEFFEIIMLLVFSVALGRVRRGHAMFNFWAIAAIALLVFGVMGIYLFNISLRGQFDFSTLCSTEQFCFDSSSLFAITFPDVAPLAFLLAGYFVFGVYFTSVSLSVLAFQSVESFIRFFIPFGVYALAGEHESSIGEAACGVIVDCAVSWVPSLMKLVYVFGCLGVIVLFVGFGRAAKKLSELSIDRTSVLSSVCLFFIFFFIISVPSGDFIFVSSSNTFAFLLSYAVLLSASFLKRPPAWRVLSEIAPRSTRASRFR